MRNSEWKMLYRFDMLLIIKLSKSGPFVDQFPPQLSNSLFNSRLWFLPSIGLYFVINFGSLSLHICQMDQSISVCSSNLWS